jgi:hypothetical protein
MTVRTRALCCDHSGCPRKITGGAGPRSRMARRLRRRTAEEGWTRTVGGADLCPEHAGAAEADNEQRPHPRP